MVTGGYSCGYGWLQLPDQFLVVSISWCGWLCTCAPLCYVVCCPALLCPSPPV